MRAVRLEGRSKMGPELVFYQSDDFVLETGCERRGNIVVDHGAATFVAAFLENSLRRNVSWHIVGVSVEPQPQAIELALESQGVVDDHLARQERHRERIAELPGLHRVRYGVGQFA